MAQSKSSMLTNSNARKDKARKAGKCQICGDKTSGFSAIIDYDKGTVSVRKAKPGHAFYCKDHAEKKRKRYEWKLERKSTKSTTGRGSRKQKRSTAKKATKATPRKRSRKAGSGTKAKRTRKGTAAKASTTRKRAPRKASSKAKATPKRKRSPRKASGGAATKGDPF